VFYVFRLPTQTINKNWRKILHSVGITLIELGGISLKELGGLMSKLEIVFCIFWLQTQHDQQKLL